MKPVFPFLLYYLHLEVFHCNGKVPPWIASQLLKHDAEVSYSGQGLGSRKPVWEPWLGHQLVV